jgi:polyether ionophore transport system permease protein
LKEILVQPPAGPSPPPSGATSGASSAGPAWPALVRRAFRDGRTRTITFAYLFALYAYIQPAGYRHTYPTVADRLEFARSFANNDALRLFYGYPYDTVTVGGYTAWRVGGTAAILAAAFGVLAAVRALRAEEDAGRAELVLAGAVSRGTFYWSALLAIGAGAVILWAAEFAGFVVGGLPAGGSAYLALATVSLLPVFAGAGAVVSQLAPSRRVALQLGSAVVAVAWLLRVVADTSGGERWLQWVTPLGWAELLRPFTGAQPAVLLLPAAASAVLLVISARLSARRDVGTGVLPARDTTAPHLGLLSSPTAQALRSERGSFAVWLASVGAFAAILGMVSASVSSAGISKSLAREIAKLGSGSILSPTGYLAFVFVFFILVVSLFCCAQISAARHEEADQQLETLLALPVGRGGWLAGRLLLAGAGAAVLSLLAGALAWGGAASQGVNVSLPKMLEAGANCLPVALVFLGLAALAYALVPRASAGLAYGLVTVAFLWNLTGDLLGAPKWVVDLTPFAHVGLVPVQAFDAGAAAAMAGIGVAASLGAIALFRRRDLLGA